MLYVYIMTNTTSRVLIVCGDTVLCGRRLSWHICVTHVHTDHDVDAIVALSVILISLALTKSKRQSEPHESQSSMAMHVPGAVIIVFEPEARND